MLRVLDETSYLPHVQIRLYMCVRDRDWLSSIGHYSIVPNTKKIKLKNKLVLVDPRVLDKPPAIGGYKEIQKPADALSKTLLNTNNLRIYRNKSISEEGVGDEKAKLYSHALSQYNNNKILMGGQTNTHIELTMPPY